MKEMRKAFLWLGSLPPNTSGAIQGKGRERWEGKRKAVGGNIKEKRKEAKGFPVRKENLYPHDSLGLGDLSLYLLPFASYFPKGRRVYSYTLIPSSRSLGHYQELYIRKRNRTHHRISLCPKGGTR